MQAVRRWTPLTRRATLEAMTTKAIAFLATRSAAPCRHFYEDVLGLDFVEENEFALVFDAFGTTLRIQKTADVKVAPYTAFGLAVDDLEATVTGVTNKGARPKSYPGLEQDERGIWRAPSGARVAWLTDPDGHTISLSQSPP